MTWIDISIILLVVVNIFIGYRRGLILTLFSIGSYVLAYLFSKSYYIDFSQWLQSRPSFLNGVYGFVGKNIEITLPVQGAEQVQEPIHSIGELIASMKLPGFIQNYLLGEVNLQNYAVETIEKVQDLIIGQLTELFIDLLSMIILFILARLIILGIGQIINGIFKLPVLGTINQIGGGFIGGLKGGILVFIGMIILFSITLTTPEGTIANTLEDSKVFMMIWDQWASKII
ncbi:hypothetical protein Amet_4782 [Alkaliphilus metalliredigens QYMF]|uniref:Colicin V production protein n=1 Tax=Alkaliphilus metalliredigens (strain QYMF) TaxID=293826 RepID=A6TXD0_ALKMQ|nr:CvpA family protein [Alkaliphilus metalliredigens]ABR50848.1 hypothetical protein Amet_4782 [Alkaliphilus metalliredigens QYMF]